MRIKILGNGGFISSGIPYNSFIINDNFLIETPPDIMVSLRNHGIRFFELTRIFLSHFHGDHLFGMPFIVLNLMKHSIETELPAGPIEMIGPAGTRDALKAVQRLAVGDHPSVGFIDTLFRFVEIDENAEIPLDEERRMVFHRMAHPMPTYGFSIVGKSGYSFTYFADTVWSDSFLPILANKPRVVFCDLNSRPDEKIKQHMTEQEIVEKALPVTGSSTRYVGVHLSREGGEERECLHYSKAGEEYGIG